MRKTNLSLCPHVLGNYDNATREAVENLVEIYFDPNVEPIFGIP